MRDADGDRFRSDAATAAYLATLSAAQHAKAAAYTQGGEWLLLWGLLVDLAVAWIILRTGCSADRGTRARRQPCRRGLHRHLPRAGLAHHAAVVDIYGVVRERAYGLSRQPLGGWLKESLLSAIIGTLLAVLLALAVYALARRTPRRWWAWSGGVASLAIIFTVVLGRC